MNNQNQDPRDNNSDVDDAQVLDGEVLEPMNVGALATIHRTEIDSQVATAKQYPRNLTLFKQEILALATMDEETAEECVYALPRGGKTIRGPSARFADALISLFGNAFSDAYPLTVNKEEGYVEAVGMFRDVERNTVRRRRTRRNILSSRGQIYNADMINMTMNAACVIAERNAILAGVPKQLWSPAYDRAFAVIAGTIQTLDSKRDRAMKAFSVMGIQPEQVLEKLGYSDISRIVPDDIVTLRGILTALKTGEETLEAVFGRGAGGHQHETVRNPLKDKANGESETSIDDQMRARAREIAERAAQQGSKNDPISSGRPASNGTPNQGSQARREPAEAGSAAPANSSQPAQNNARQAAPPQASNGNGRPYEMTADAYVAFVHDQLDTAKSKAAINDMWGATRADRNELLNDEQRDSLTADKDMALRKFAKGGV